MSHEEMKVKHNPDRYRFEIDLGEEEAKLVYRKRGKKIIFSRCEVPEGFEDKGLSGKLSRAGLEYAKDHSLDVVVWCPEVEGFIKRNPEYASLVVEEEEER